MKVTTDTKLFTKTMNNIVDYSFGFIEGINRGKTIFFKNLGSRTIDVLAAYIDSEARANPGALHHVYEWYQTGSPSARLFDLNYTISGYGLSVNSKFRQSKTLSNTSTEPFYNKAEIMENGIPIHITPVKKDKLTFEIDGEMVFANEVTVENPGGPNVQGSYEKVFDSFFRYYFSQSFLRASGLIEYLENPTVYKKNMLAGSKRGKPQGIRTGYTWITNATIGVE